MHVSRRCLSFLFILALQGRCLQALTTMSPVPISNLVPVNDLVPVNNLVPVNDLVPANVIPAAMVLNARAQQAFQNPFGGGTGWYVALVPAPLQEPTTPPPGNLHTTADTTPTTRLATTPPPVNTTTAAPPPAPPTPAPARPPARRFPNTNRTPPFWQSPLFLASMEGGDSMRSFLMARVMQQHQTQRQMQFQQQQQQQQQQLQQNPQQQQKEQMPQMPGFNRLDQLAPLSAMFMMGDSFRNLMAANLLSRSMGMGGGLLTTPLAYKALGDLPEYYYSLAAPVAGPRRK